jgi:hypothetical protein
MKSDPLAGVDRIEAIADAFEAGVSQVTNEGIKALAEKARDSLRGVVTMLDGVLDHPDSVDPAAADSLAVQVQNDFNAIADACETDAP